LAESSATNGIAPNATARRFRRKVSCEMQVRLPAQTAHAKMRDGGGIGGQVLCAVSRAVLFLWLRNQTVDVVNPWL
jgi:hypothetical protein